MINTRWNRAFLAKDGTFIESYPDLTAQRTKHDFAGIRTFYEVIYIYRIRSTFLLKQHHPMHCSKLLSRNDRSSISFSEPVSSTNFSRCELKIVFWGTPKSTILHQIAKLIFTELCILTYVLFYRKHLKFSVSALAIIYPVRMNVQEEIHVHMRRGCSIYTYIFSSFFPFPL